MNNKAILYSFRRCPYAIRARLALIASDIHVEHREIELRNKPQAMLTISPKGTVPVLLTPQGQVIDESWYIMLWAFEKNPHSQLLPTNIKQLALIEDLLEHNDFTFKPVLDRYKYADRYPEHPMHAYRSQGEQTLLRLNMLLSQHRYLVTEYITAADFAIMPFIRQFAFVDYDWFSRLPYPYLHTWLNNLLSSELFKKVMIKHPLWSGL